MSYAKPAIRPIDNQTELAGCHPCDGSAAAQLFVRAGLGEVYSKFFGPPCPAPPLVGPIEVCVNLSRQQFCAHIEPPNPSDTIVIGPGGGLPITLP